MAGIGRLDGVHRQGADGIDALLYDRVLVGHSFPPAIAIWLMLHYTDPEKKTYPGAQADKK
jgi:hypothetical protein